MLNQENFRKELAKKEYFHNKHEAFTERAYNIPGLLPDRYVFIVTNLCNLKCDFCFQRKHKIRDRMTKKDWLNVARQIPDYGRVTFCGGEPLLFSGFEELYSFIAAKFSCNIITNGILLTKEKIDFILSYPNLRVLSLSIDDIGNKIRGVNPNEWRHLIELLDYFVAKKKELRHTCVLDIKTMILDSNAKDLFSIYRFCVEKLKVDTHSFQFLKGSSLQHADVMFDLDDIFNESKAHFYKDFEDIKNQLDLVRKYNIKSRKFSFLHPNVESLIKDIRFSRIDMLNEQKYIKKNYHFCKYPWSSIHIKKILPEMDFVSLPEGISLCLSHLECYFNKKGKQK